MRNKMNAVSTFEMLRSESWLWSSSSNVVNLHRYSIESAQAQSDPQNLTTLSIDNQMNEL